jgi:hypothetical protein
MLQIVDDPVVAVKDTDLPGAVVEVAGLICTCPEVADALGKTAVSINENVWVALPVHVRRCSGATIPQKFR